MAYSRTKLEDLSLKDKAILSEIVKLLETAEPGSSLLYLLYWNTMKDILA